MTAFYKILYGKIKQPEEASADGWIEYAILQAYMNYPANNEHVEEIIAQNAAEEIYRLRAELRSKERWAEQYHSQAKELQERVEYMEAQIDALNTVMPCGHLARYAVTADEGTGYCLMCACEK